jgi:hypothetical protein
MGCASAAETSLDEEPSKKTADQVKSFARHFSALTFAIASLDNKPRRPLTTQLCNGHADGSESTRATSEATICAGDPLSRYARRWAALAKP